MFALAAPFLASFIAGYGICWYSTTPQTANEVPPLQQQTKEAPVVVAKTFHEELAEKVRADYARREYQREKMLSASDLKLVEKADRYLANSLASKFRHAVDHSPRQTAPCIVDESPPRPSGAPLFRGG